MNVFLGSLLLRQMLAQACTMGTPHPLFPQNNNNFLTISHLALITHAKPGPYIHRGETEMPGVCVRAMV